MLTRGEARSGPVRPPSLEDTDQPAHGLLSSGSLQASCCLPPMHVQQSSGFLPPAAALTSSNQVANSIYWSDKLQSGVVADSCYYF